ncbi:hypothetical protein R1sor_023133 [Riccia sorocarpa]|uniref:RRM domain-containing protein n=1 Tax=Riccia sorocarpa TaxID=122646 RepID=A0ABD3GLU2_9MARC
MEGKKVKERNAGVGDELKESGPSSSDDTDLHTVFVRSLPFSLTDSQLEDIFSEIGPVRHCFTIKEKGSDQHRGFGFVHFAVTEDAQRAVQEKNGALVQGRKIKVELAKRRASLDQRRPPKPNPPNADSTVSEDQQTSNPDGVKAEPRKRKSSELPKSQGVEKDNAEQRKSKKVKPDGQVKDKVEDAEGRKDEVSFPGGEQKANKKFERKITGSDVPLHRPLENGETKDQREVHGSEKQRPARTVVVGNLSNTEMLESVLAVAKTVGSVESVQRNMSEHEINSKGLAKDGCKPRAAAIVFLSVKAAMQAVAALHTKSIGGGVVWARQLGGEGSKLKKWRLIVRNLPFQATETEVRELFSHVGFLWEVSIPRKPDGTSKGFAFVGYTTKANSEKAIKSMNGKTVGKRPIAVDWAVGKSQYETAVSAAKAPGHSEAPQAADSDLEGSDTTASDASEDEMEDDSEDDSDEEQPAAGNMKSNKIKPPGKEMVREAPLVEKARKKSTAREEVAPKEEKTQQETATEKSRKESKPFREEADEETLPQEENKKEKRTRVEHVDINQEMGMMKKILNKVVSSTQKSGEAPAVSDEDDEDEKPAVSLDSERPKKKANEPKGRLGTIEKAVDPAASAENADDNPMERTLFIRNLPTDAEVRELRKLFSDFGVVKSFRMVLHPVTSRPKGTAFLEYATKEAADSAVAAASTSGDGRTGLMIKGRQISVTSAVDRDTARNMAKTASIAKEQDDRRNLALAKEGLIQEGTSAAEGVSKKDIEKRKMLEREKGTKLRSPNFHISRTRLSVHNVPKGLTEKALKKLFIDAVKARASKQHPVIKQVKILRDDVTGKARGTAFVEFTEHQHALVALRVLNNNPATFTAENRPIVEFAVENSLILRKRAVQLDRQKKFQALKQNVNMDSSVGEEMAPKQKKRKLRGDKADREVDEPMHGDETPTKSGRTEKEKKKGERKMTGPEGVMVEEKTGRKRKRKEEDKLSEIGKGKAQRGKKNLTVPVNGQKERVSAKSRTSGSGAVKQAVVTTAGQKTKGGSVKQRGTDGNHAKDDASLKESRRRRKLSKVAAAEDRLDKLVNEYRTKYFTVGPATESKTKGSGRETISDLRRWFE